ncbi:MAG: hypothetical protein MGF17_00200 [Trichodesmium sp. MAG_R04]|nr:hypothetical protein [Trichodesmium sp. MAG_R04]
MNMQLTVQEQQNLKVVRGFFNSFLLGQEGLFDYIDDNFQPDIEYTVITPTNGINNPQDYLDTTFTHERQGAVPFTGIKNGINEIKDFFLDLYSEFDVVDFKTDKFVVEGENVSVFGGLSYINKETGNQADFLPLAIDIVLKDGKFDKYSFYEDSFAFAATARQGGEWRRFWDEEWTNVFFGTKEAETLEGDDAEKNVIYGYQENDTLQGGQNDDVLWGGGNNDELDGQGGQDTLYGNTGNNTLTGGSGQDVFGIGLDQGTNIITDFIFNEDKLGLTGSLAVFQRETNGQVNLDGDGNPILDIDANDSTIIGDLQITTTIDNDLTIATTNGTILATLRNGAEWATLTDEQKRDIFQEIPNGDRTTANSEATAEGFFNAFVDGTISDYIRNNFDPNLEYNVVGTESNLFGVERESILSHTGLYEGIDGALFFFDLTDTERTVLSFDIHETFGSGDFVASFGSFRYSSDTETGGSGDILETEWATRIELLDGKFFRYQFLEDSYAVPTGYRHKFNALDDDNQTSEDEGIEYRRQFGGVTRDIIAGTNAEDTIDQSTNINPVFLFGYRGNDIVIGGNNNDSLYGGEGNNRLTGNAGSDLFAIGLDQGEATITDFTQGEDKFALTQIFSQDELAPPFGENATLFTPLSGELKFEDLNFTSFDSNLVISVKTTVRPSGDLLAIVEGAAGTTLTEDDFKILPTPPSVTQVSEAIDLKENPDQIGRAASKGFFLKSDPFGEVPDNISNDEVTNVRTVEKIIQALLEGSDAQQWVSNDLEFTAIGTESDLFGYEREAVLPHSGLYTGKNGVQEFFDTLSQEGEILDINVEQIYGNDHKVAVFGTFEALGESGDVVGSDFAARFWLVEEDGKPVIYRGYLYEDSIALATGLRSKKAGDPILEWTREFAGKDQKFIGGTNADENFTGIDSKRNEKEITGELIINPETGQPEPEPLRNRIFGYGGNDSITGGISDDFLYGGEGNDTLDGHDGNDDLYGYPGNDNLIGGLGDDNLYGNEGNDTVTGGPGRDIFVLAKGDGVDIITDYTDGTDQLGLLPLLSYSDLNIFQDSADTTITTQTGELLAILQGVQATDITEEDFTSRSDTGAVVNPRRDLLGFPEFNFNENYPVFDHPLNDISLTPDEEVNLQVVEGFIASFLDGTLFDYIDQNFADNIRYTVITPTLGVNNPSDYSDNTFTHERQVAVPFTGIKVGKEAVKNFFGDLLSEFEVQSQGIRTDKIVIDGNNIAFFGALDYINQETGNRAEFLPLAIDITLEDGKFIEYHFYEDSFAFAATARQGGEWTRFWDEEWTNFWFGTKEMDIATLDSNTRNNIIYGYQDNDILDGKEGDDAIYGGYGADTVKGGPGNDQLWGDGASTGTPGDNNPANNPGPDIFVLAANEGTDTIYDFTRDIDQVSLLGDLTFDDLTLNSNNGDNQIIVTSTNEVLAVVKGVTELYASDFGATPGGQVFGTLNDDELNIVNGSVIVFAGRDNDTIDASQSSGNNYIYGGKNDDLLIGSNNNRLFGQLGDDILLPGNGESILSGGQGVDQFWIANGTLTSTPNTITDFELGVDIFVISGLGVNFDDLLITQQGENTLIGILGQDIAVLSNIDSTNLNANNFAFV